MRSDADRLCDILTATAKIKERIADSIDAFQGDEMLQVWAIHHLQVIGEAARGVSQSLKERHRRETLQRGWSRVDRTHC
jgi:uncharacterized protein with HEPN domain